MRMGRKECYMTEDEQRRTLDREEIEGEEAVELPDREAMSVISTGPVMHVPPVGGWPPEMNQPETAD
jgi:hypothetical protein